MSHACIAHWHRPNSRTVTRTYTKHIHHIRLFDKQCRTAIIISTMVILMNRLPVGDRAPPHRPTHANNVRPSTRASNPCHNGCKRCRLVLFVLCPLNILAVQADDDDGSSGIEELSGWPARQHMDEAGIVPTPTLCLVNRGVWIMKF